MFGYKKAGVFLCALISAFCGGFNAYAVNFTQDRNFSFSMPKFGAVNEFDEKLEINADYAYIGENLYSGMNFPSAYDMREDYAISPVRKQTGFGTCWVHSAIASAESSIIDAVPDIDLSEFHSGYYPYYGDECIKRNVNTANEILNLGGNVNIITNIWSQWKGPVLESRIPYGDTDFFENAENVAEMQNFSDYHLKNAYMFDYDRKRTNETEVNNLIKKFIYSGKAVDVSFCHNSENCYNSENRCSYSKKRPRFSNHSVAVIGWDDNFPADNFTVKPENDGAWLVRNSWGNTYANNGYMWISYDDESLCEFAVFELSDKDDYTVMYSHDTYVVNQNISAFDDSATNSPSYIANVFENNSNNDIEAISTYIGQAGTSYEITVYTGLTDISDPCSGTSHFGTVGTADISGYVTIELDEKIPLSEDDKYFGVVVKLYNENTPFVIPLEMALTVTDDKTGEIFDLSSYSTNEQIKNSTNKNESFFSADGKKWNDVTENDYIYTEEEEKFLLDDLREQLMDGVEEDDTEETEKVENILKGYKEKFDSGYVTFVMGNIPLKAVGNPRDTVKFSHISGEVPLNEKIELSGSEEIYYYTDSPENMIKYSEPISIEKPVTIYASADGVNFSQRKYKPAKAQLNFLNYSGKSVSSAEKFSESRYNIYVGEDCENILLYPSSAADLVTDGKEVVTDEYSVSVKIKNPVTSVKISASQENKLDNIITINIYKTCSENPKAGDINGDSMTDSRDASGILEHYANISTGGDGKIEPEILPLADMDGDGLCNSSDASDILAYYSVLSTQNN
ncbi:MAG: hypothetical protein IKS03_08910 [Ruminococcus sp.]|nr:hypothetical protein [Ruminococcus sp.]